MTDADRLTNLVCLLQWIEGARMLYDDLQNAANGFDKQLAGLLKQHNIRYNTDWNERASNAFETLLSSIGEAVRSMASQATEESPSAAS